MKAPLPFRAQYVELPSCRFGLSVKQQDADSSTSSRQSLIPQSGMSGVQEGALRKALKALRPAANRETPRLAPTRLEAYSLIEVLIAGAVLAAGVAAAAIMASALMIQGEANGHALQAYNAQEQAARLWQLGLAPATITNILPERCSSLNPPPLYNIHLSFTVSTTNINGISNIPILNPLRLVFHSGSTADGTALYQTNDVIVVRPSIR